MDRVFKCGEREYKIGKSTYIMGVLNVTPDSFSDGGAYLDRKVAISHARSMEEAGADIIDVGGESSRPGSMPVPLEEERKRVIPLIEQLVKVLEVPISVDTYKGEVAKEALKVGASMVNDISGLCHSPEMAKVVADMGASVIIMHMQGEPHYMQVDPVYEDVVLDIKAFFKAQVQRAKDAGIPKDRIILDPGIGFGKTTDHNLAILARLSEFKELGLPILVGTSRKSFIGNLLGTGVDERLEGSLATNVAAVMGGADMVRVHDVLETARAMIITDRIVRR